MSSAVGVTPRQQASGGVGERPVVVATWHERARRLGLSERLPPDFCAVSRAELSRRADEHSPLCAHAGPVMDMLHQQIRDSHSMVILTDATGLILHALGDADFREKADRVALRPGVLWSEESKGTNAIGTALTDGRATVVNGSEHFLAANRFLTCSCAPIRDPSGRVIGALDVSAAKELHHAHTMALVRLSAQLIESHLFIDAFNQTVRLHFHPRREFLGTLEEGIVAFDEGGRFVAANSAARLQLGLPPDVLPSHTLSSLFGITVAGLVARSRTVSGAELTLRLRGGVTAAARLHFCAPATQVCVAGPSPAEIAARETASATRERGAYALEELRMGEPAMDRVIERVRKVQRQGIPIVILGETGTGKEILARAIHGDSSRSAKPFVAVDCASIPDSLIEAELFGYEEGAFTGARRKGAPGKILAANGGTLFLDEIGDMPLGMQTRLLRVLQERFVSPLGSNKAVAVDIAVICATHRNLQEMIRRGEFRQDLYYRLNGLVVRLPPLRERCDLELLIEHVLVSHCAAAIPPTVSREVLALFGRYAWPGNLRQLANVLRTAAVMAADDVNIIRAEHLPDDFLEDLRHHQLLDPPGCVRDGEPKTPPSGAVEAEAPGSASSDDTAPGILKDMRVSAIRSALDRHAGNVSAAARALGISRNTVYRVLRGE